MHLLAFATIIPVSAYHLLQEVSRTFEGPAFIILRPAMKHLKGLYRHWTNLKNRRYASGRTKQT